MSRALLPLGRRSWSIYGFVLALILMVANVHATTVTAVSEDAAASPGTPSSLALLGSGLVLLLLVRRRYRLR